MRIAITYPGCHRRAGVERVMLESVNYLAAQGHEVHAFARDWDADKLRPDVVRHDLRFSSLAPAVEVPAFRLASARAISAMVPPPDVVAGFGATAPEGSVTWMTSVHATWIETARRVRGLRGRLRQRVNPFHPVVLRLERRLLEERRYGALVALTSQVKDDLIRLYGVPTSDIEVVPNGYSPDEFHPVTSDGRASARGRFGFGEDTKVVLFVANELERKGFSPLVEAIRQLNDPTVRLLAVGGFNQGHARKRLEQVGLSHRAVVLGSSDVAECYAAADVFVLPTTYEAWGLVIIEALASGVPVVTSRRAGAAVAVRPGETGVLLDEPGDPDEIMRGIVQFTNKTGMSAHGIAGSVKPFEWNNVLARYEQVLQRGAAS